jgi:hypothetical protein
MAEFLEVLETIRAQEASVERLFGAEGTNVARMTRGPRYMQSLAEAAQLISDVYQGRRKPWQLQEAMSTSDFPLLFGDVLDRQLLATYRENIPQWRNFAGVRMVRDFRNANLFTLAGASGVLDEVAELGEYKAASLSEARYQISVVKFGRYLPFSWEAMVNDDLDALKDSPNILALASRRTEARRITQTYVDANGPHATLFTAANGNIITGNPPFSLAALKTALGMLAAMVDADGEPINVDMVELVVGPALKGAAQDFLNTLSYVLDTNDAAGTARTQQTVVNWIKNGIRLTVDPYIPLVATAANGATSWFLFASVSAGNRPAILAAFLRGYEEPQLFMKDPNMRRIGGSQVGPLEGDFEHDALMYKVRHCFGTARVDPRMALGSNGTGIP